MNMLIMLNGHLRNLKKVEGKKMEAGTSVALRAGYYLDSLDDLVILYPDGSHDFWCDYGWRKYDNDDWNSPLWLFLSEL